MTADGIGVAVRRKEDRRFLTGTGRYTDDIDRFGQVYACFVRSPYAHATVESIDTASAARSRAERPSSSRDGWRSCSIRVC